MQFVVVHTRIGCYRYFGCGALVSIIGDKMPLRIFRTSLVLLSFLAFTPVASADSSGLASFYGKEFHGRRQANGKAFNMNAMTAAHRTYAFGTRVRVTNLANGKSVVLRIADRGPFVRKRIIDVSYAAARSLGFVKRGVTRVRVEKLS